MDKLECLADKRKMDEYRRLIVEEKDNKKKAKMTASWKELAQRVFGHSTLELIVRLITKIFGCLFLLKWLPEIQKKRGQYAMKENPTYLSQMWSKFVASGKDSIPYKTFLEEYPAVMDLGAFEPGDEFVLAAALDVKKDPTGKLTVTTDGYDNSY